MDRRNFDVDVDAIEQGSGNLGHVALDHRRRAHALPRFVVEVSARAGIHRGRQHEARRKAERHGGAGDGDLAVFQRLAKHLQHIAGEFRQLVQKEQAIVGE